MRLQRRETAGVAPVKRVKLPQRDDIELTTCRCSQPRQRKHQHFISVTSCVH